MGVFIQNAGLGFHEDMCLKLKDTVADSYFKSKNESSRYAGAKPGRLWYLDAIMDDGKGLFEDILAYGPCWFRWVCNRSGGTLTQGALASFYTKGSLTATSGSTTTWVDSAAPFVADEEVHNLLHILDDAGGAGAAPEGEARHIIKNTTTTLTVQPPFSAAVAVGDTAQIMSKTQVIASAAGHNRSRVAGVVVSPDGIADNYWGWVCCKGVIATLVQASTAITIDKGLIAHTGRATISSSSSLGLIVGAAHVGVSNDIVSDLMMVDIDVLFGVGGVTA